LQNPILQTYKAKNIEKFVKIIGVHDCICITVHLQSLARSSIFSLSTSGLYEMNKS